MSHKEATYVFYYRPPFRKTEYSTPRNQVEIFYYNPYGGRNVIDQLKHHCYGSIEMDDKEGRGEAKLNIDICSMSPYDDKEMLQQFVNYVRSINSLPLIKIKRMVCFENQQ